MQRVVAAQDRAVKCEVIDREGRQAEAPFVRQPARKPRQVGARQARAQARQRDVRAEAFAAKRQATGAQGASDRGMKMRHRLAAAGRNEDHAGITPAEGAKPRKFKVEPRRAQALKRQMQVADQRIGLVVKEGKRQVQVLGRHRAADGQMFLQAGQRKDHRLRKVEGDEGAHRIPVLGGVILPAAPQSPGVAEFNPAGKVPVLIVDNTPVTDSTAILQFLADRHGQFTHPAGSLERARQDSLTQFLLDEFDAALWMAARHTFVLPEHLRQAAIKDTLRWEFERSQHVLVHRMGEGPFIMGDAMTVPDIILTHCLTWALAAKFPVVEHRLTEYLDRMRARPAYGRAMAR